MTAGARLYMCIDVNSVNRLFTSTMVRGCHRTMIRVPWTLFSSASVMVRIVFVIALAALLDSCVATGLLMRKSSLSMCIASIESGGAACSRRPPRMYVA